MPRNRPDQTAGLAEALSAISRRLWISAILRASALALPLGAVAWMVLTRAGLTAATAALLVVVVTMGITAAWLTRIGSRWTARAAAGALEDAHPSSRNVVITAEELLRHPERATPAVRARVLHEGAEIARGVAAPRVVSLGRPAAFAAAGFGLRRRPRRGRPAARCTSGDAGRRGSIEASGRRLERRIDDLGHHHAASLYPRTSADDWKPRSHRGASGQPPQSGSAGRPLAHSLRGRSIGGP